jgi:hypothetical protein
MKFAMRLLLIGALAIGPVGCNRNQPPDESVSANADRTDRSEQAQKNETVNERTTDRQRQATRETRPAYRAPEKQADRSREYERTDNRTTDNRTTDNRNDRAVEPVEREDRAVQTTRRSTASVPSGTAFTVTLADRISTESNQEGDSFTAHLSQPIVVNGRVVADKGDRVTGHIKKLDEPGKVKGRARLELVLDEIRTSRDSYKLSTEPFIVVGEDTHERDAAEIGGGAAVGAAIGAITGGKKGAAIGAVIGGGTGTTAVLLTKGKQLNLEPETKVNFVLSRNVDLPVIRNSNT